MSDQLRPCPFCGSDEIEMGQASEPWLWKYYCDTCGASSCHHNHHVDGYKERLLIRWNTRPIEDRLRKDLEKAKGALASLANGIQKTKDVLGYSTLSEWLDFIEHTLEEIEGEK